VRGELLASVRKRRKTILHQPKLLSSSRARRYCSLCLPVCSGHSVTQLVREVSLTTPLMDGISLLPYTPADDSCCSLGTAINLHPRTAVFQSTQLIHSPVYTGALEHRRITVLSTSRLPTKGRLTTTLVTMKDHEGKGDLTYVTPLFFTL